MLLGSSLVRFVLLAAAVAAAGCSAKEPLDPDGAAEPTLAKSSSPRANDGARHEREPPWTPHDAPWGYVMPIDHGIRADGSGKGYFLAPRSHGVHNGVDLLAPLGTPALSACEGKARSGAGKGFGRWVQVVCPLPSSLGPAHAVASLLYAHLGHTPIPSDWTRVHRGQTVGSVGKTGNASAPDVSSHLHLEILILPSEERAMKERHAGRDVSSNHAADDFFAKLSTECLVPAGLDTRGPDVRRARRADPFLVLACAVATKPAFSIPSAPNLAEAAVRWSEHYSAARFDVDAARR